MARKFPAERPTAEAFVLAHAQASVAAQEAAMEVPQETVRIARAETVDHLADRIRTMYLALEDLRSRFAVLRKKTLDGEPPA